MIEHRKTSVTYRGDGVTTSFPFSFDISSADTIRVAIYDTATEITTEITRDYFVDVSAKVVHYPGYAPGQAPAAAAQPPKLPNGKTITIYRKTPINQLTNLGAKYPLPSIEAMSDKAIAILQEHDEMLGRTVTLHAGDPKMPEQRLTDLQTYVLNAKNAASAADQSAQSASASKASAASSASSSAQSAAASEASRQASAESESKIKNMQVDVHAMQQHVDEVKTAIDGVAARAKADGQTASDAAVQAQRSAGASAQSAVASEASAVRAEAATKYEGIVKSENLAEKSVHKKHLHQDAYESPALTGTPTTPTAVRGTNNTQIANTAFVAQAIAALVNSAPGALDTLQELAAALGNDANFAATITNALAKKVSKSGDTVTGELKFDHINTACIIGSLLNENAWRIFNGRGRTHTGFLAFDITNEDTEGIFLRKFDKTFSREIIAATLLDSENNTAFPGVVSSARGFKGDLKGTASNSNNLEGKSLQWLLDQINAAKTGIVAGSLTQNGWVKFANGLIVQWGVGAEVSGEQQFDITLPISFQNACFHVSVTVIQSRGVGSNYGEDFQIVEYNRDKIKLFLQHFELNAKPAKPLYIAVGV